MVNVVMHRPELVRSWASDVVGLFDPTTCGTTWLRYGRRRPTTMAITASEARKKLFPLIEQVNEDRTPVEIISKRGNAVLMSADDYSAWVETAYLFHSPTNARRLLDAAESARRGDLTEPALDRDE